MIDGTGLRDSLVLRNLKDVAEKNRQFYKSYATLASPRLLWKKKWQLDPDVEVKPGDVVRVLEATKFKNKYMLARVTGLETSHDGKKRTAALEYITTSDNGIVTRRNMRRPIQRLALVAKASELPLGEDYRVSQREDDEFEVKSFKK